MTRVDCKADERDIHLANSFVFFLVNFTTELSPGCCACLFGFFEREFDCLDVHEENLSNLKIGALLNVEANWT